LCTGLTRFSIWAWFTVSWFAVSRFARFTLAAAAASLLATSSLADGVAQADARFAAAILFAGVIVGAILALVVFRGAVLAVRFGFSSVGAGAGARVR